MCGIFCLINSQELLENKKFYNHFIKNKKRGPENEKLLLYNNNLLFGFHRLAINGLDTKSNQPLYHKGLVMIGNGEIFNFKQLCKTFDIQQKTNSDMEVILHLYDKIGLNLLNYIIGEFSFILFDYKISKLFIVRDPFGIRPLYYCNHNNKYAFSSTLSSINTLPIVDPKKIKQFRPGNVMSLTMDGEENFNFCEEYSYYTLPPSNHEGLFNINTNNDNDVYKMVVEAFEEAVRVRTISTDRPMGALLSGGLDSSLVAAIANNISINELGFGPIHTFSIGLPGSEDLKFAKKVSTHIGSIHHEIIVTEEEFFDSIPNVIYDVETYDTTTVRASVGNWLVSKWIKENTDIKVVLNGDGSDELLGGYLYFKKAPTYQDFDLETRKLLNNIYKFDVLRSDRSISSHGLETRTPFLDVNFVKTIYGLHPTYRRNNNAEKYIIRKSFGELRPNLLPAEVLWRKKEAFSDGVSSLDKSWYQIIQENIESLFKRNISLKSDVINTITPTHLDVDTIEKKYYYYIFNTFYPRCSHLIDYYWMPNFIKNATDASARTLDVYNE